MHFGGGKCPSLDGGLSDSYKTPLEGGAFSREDNLSSREDADLAFEERRSSAIPSKLSLGAGRKTFFVLLLLLLVTVFMQLALFLLREGSQIPPGLLSNSPLTPYIPFLFASVHKNVANEQTFKSDRTFHFLNLHSKSQKYRRNFEVHRNYLVCRKPFLKYYFCKESSNVSLSSVHLAEWLIRKLLSEKNNPIIASYGTKFSGINDLKDDGFGSHEQSDIQQKSYFNSKKIVASAHYPNLILVPFSQNSPLVSKSESNKTENEFSNPRKIILENSQKLAEIGRSNSYQWRRKRKLIYLSNGKEIYHQTSNRRLNYKLPYQSGNAALPPLGRVLNYYSPREVRNADAPPKSIQNSTTIPTPGNSFIGINGSSNGRRNVKYPQPNGNGISKMTGIPTGAVRKKRSLPVLVESPGGEIYFPGGYRWDWKTSSTSGDDREWERTRPFHEGNGLLEGSSGISSERKFSLPEEDQMESGSPFQDVVWDWHPDNENDGKKQRSLTTQREKEGTQALLPHLERSTFRVKQTSENGESLLTKFIPQNEEKYGWMYSRKDGGKWGWEFLPLNGAIDMKKEEDIYPISNIEKTLDSSFISEGSSEANVQNEKNPQFLLPGVRDSMGISSSSLWNEGKNQDISISTLRKTQHPTTRRKDSELKPLVYTKHPTKIHKPRVLKRKRAERIRVDRTTGNKKGGSFSWGIRSKANKNPGDSFLAFTRDEEQPDISQNIGGTGEKNLPSGRKFMVEGAGKGGIKNADASGIKENEGEGKNDGGGEYQDEEGSLKGEGQQPNTSDKRALPGDYREKIKAKRLKRKIDLSSVSVIEGEEAALPCDLRSPDPNDAVQIILWIKEGSHTPLYSYDFRELLKGQPKETKPDSNSTLSRRTSFRKDRSPAALVIERTEVEDGGIYRCRVDFLLSPTVNHRVNLTVIVPPSKVRITWYSDNSTLMTSRGSVVGPFLVGSRPTLICTNDDGWPPPSVVWLEDDQVLDDSYGIDLDRGLVENDLTLAPLTRDDLGKRLTCLASNTNRTRPAVISVRIELSLRILGVKVQEIGTLWASERATAVCRIWGSRPPPNVVWWLGSLMLPPTETKTEERNDNVTLSYLAFVPSSEDDGAMLICQATNEALPEIAVQDSTILNVNYAPMVSVSLGRSLDPEKIKEGDDVYFECSVVSKPPVTSVIWKHNGVHLVSGSGIITSNMSLVVQGVTRSHGGTYTCHATNSRNTSSSPPLLLDVKYTPVCAIEQRQQHSVGKLENAEIACKVDANPRDVTFRWTFNNTAEAIDVPEGRFVVVGTESRVNYTPMNELDYGTLLCWANNSIGMQQYPCVFQIVAAGKPDPPHNCKVSDVTISSLQVSCLPGDDGGLDQTFLLQIYKVGSTSPVTELSQSHPSFSLTNLTPATSYRIVLAALNYKGASRLKELNAHTLKVPESLEETSAEPARDRERGTNIPLALLIGTIVAVVPIVIASVVFVWLKVCRSTSASNDNRDSEADGARTNSENDPTTHSSQTKGNDDQGSTEFAISELPIPHEDRDPDVLPQASTDPSWPEQQMVNVATISGPPYPLAEGEKRYTPVALASTITSTSSPASIQLHQIPVSATSPVPYKADCAQHHQMQDSTSKSPSHQKWYTTNIIQEQNRVKESSSMAFQGGEFNTDKLNSHAGPQAPRVRSIPQAFQLPSGSTFKGLQNLSQRSLHRCQDDQNLGLQSAARPATISGVTRQGSVKVIAQSRGFSQQALSASISTFQSMGDISQYQRALSRSDLVNPLTASLNRRTNRDVFVAPFNTIESQSCQHLIKTLPDRQSRHNKRESAV